MLRYHEHSPPPALRAHLECLWIVSDPRRRTHRPIDRVLPDGCPELIVHLGDPFSRQVAGRWKRQPRAFLAGTLSRPWLLRAGPSVRTLGIRFRPGAISSLFPIDLSKATDREVALDELMTARDARELVRGVRIADRRGRAVETAERWLRARPIRARSQTTEATRPMVSAILRTHGRARIDELALSLGVPRRRLERAFAHDLGIRPKLFARIVRLNAALARLGTEQGVRAVDWALAAGYFDQAHLARDFRAVAGRRAGLARETDGELARHFTAPARLLAYLAGE